MSIVHVRGIDERVYTVLQKEAKKKNISFSELIRQILNQYVSRIEIEAVDQKYRTFVQEQIALYRMDQDEMRQILMQNSRLYLQIMETLERWDK